MSKKDQGEQTELDVAWAGLTDSKKTGAGAWVLYGLDGSGKKLEVQGNGEGGLPELQTKLDVKQIQFAGLRVVSSDAGEKITSNRPKYVVIVFVGKSVSPIKRASALKYKEEFSKVARGASVFTQFTDPEDITAKDIAKELCRSSGDQVTSIDFGGDTTVTAEDLGLKK
eukprot:TRINITY_DN1898_c0_g1_i1.p1 TRINITY_DN1898_c0_g1~~TRINITY_DN1898_c0_g1_i1.p1  ORF type:complete len:169 (+),score=32.52 TRINITY_DN1898_c0_g1_i1:139-645(+)